MRAMILAGGQGTRLRPLTDDKPKALIPFKGMPLLEHVIRNLADAGVEHIITNVHHFADMVVDFIGQLEIPGIELSVSDESEMLMDTGGALLQARDYLSEDKFFIVHNVDVYTNLDIRELIEFHRSGNALVTIAVKKRITSRSLLFSDGFLCGWRHNETGETRMVRPDRGITEDYGNSCIQVINRDFFDFFPETSPLKLIDMYLKLAPGNHIRPFVHNDDYWYDLGRYENFIKTDKDVF